MRGTRARLGWNRREFLAAGSIATLASQAGWLGAASLPIGRMAYVSVIGASAAVHVYAIAGDDWLLRQTVAADAPVALALHPNGGTLYVLHEVASYGSLPCGFLSSYRVSAEGGALVQIGEAALALSAVMPRQMAVAPDGRQLVVAVGGGGAYNAVAIDDDGVAGRVSGIVKEIGCGPIAEQQDASHPQAVVFDGTGNRVIGADLGCDRLRVLALGKALQMHSVYTSAAGGGPEHLAMHPLGHLVYVSHALNGTLQGLRYDGHSGSLMEQVTQVECGRLYAMMMHPAGEFLYGADSAEITVWKIDGDTGALQAVQRVACADVQALCVSGGAMLAVGSDGVRQLKMRVDGRLEEASWKVRLNGAARIVVRDAV